MVVYKVDRLSRSLLAFARMMETFERRGVSFVSVLKTVFVDPLRSGTDDWEITYRCAGSRWWSAMPSSIRVTFGGPGTPCLSSVRIEAHARRIHA